MGLTVPAGAVEYPDPIAAQPVIVYEEPGEGKKAAPLEFPWGVAPYTALVAHVNMANRQIGDFSQIVMLDVDNSQCGADVQFMFLDTGDTLLVPAYTSITAPVFTRSRDFYVSAPKALAIDTTRVRVLNYLQSPLDNPKSTFQNVSQVGGIALVAGTTALIPNGTAGTLAAISVPFSVQAGAGAMTCTAVIVDHGTSNQLMNSGFSLASGAAAFGNFMQLSDINWRFAHGVDLTLSFTGTAPSSGFIGPSLFYRTP